MRFNLYKDVKAFYRNTYHILLRHESQNMIPLGNLIIGNEGKDKHDWRDPVNWLMATVSNEEGIQLIAIMTPPFGITLYATDNHTNDVPLTCLIEGLLTTDFTIPTVVSEKSLAERFARSYAMAKNMQYSIMYNQRIYELKEVNPEALNIGTLRLAQESDMSFLPYWVEAFQNEALATSRNVRSDPENYRYHISTGNLYILEHEGTPVSIAKISRKMVTVCGVSFVYTPPYFRKKGYASSCVAALSRLILEQGYSKCVLYTDLANPTSNAIYQKIGYQPICDSSEIKFEIEGD
ncbi:MAG: GNAT family N-acetyltransferase [Defluviitaleaceae bacterium]|nr:GNAT family N-acetyltransferase [Defluviitaleaceae bacterium]